MPMACMMMPSGMTFGMRCQGQMLFVSRNLTWINHKNMPLVCLHKDMIYTTHMELLTLVVCS